MADVIPLGAKVADYAAHILATMRETRYKHGDPDIDPGAGTYDTDCSGFVSYILGQLVPEHLGAIPLPGSQTRLYARDFYEFFAALASDAGNGWRQINYLPDAQRGDLIAWPLPPGNADTGHIFIVADPPAALDADTTAVRAYDASDILHYDDSRAAGPGQARQTGVGLGTFHLSTVATGAAVAFQFGPGDDIHHGRIAVARVEPLGI